MNGAQAVAEILKTRGVDRIFSHAGGTISPLLDAIHKAGIEVIVFRTEAGAGHAAQAAYRITGKPQVVTVTSGPGATNLVTSIADAYYDSDAIVALTGQVGTDSMRGVLPIRQRGFQETPTVDIMRPIAKKVYGPYEVEALAWAVNDALTECVMDRPGPCVVDCPMDLQRQWIESDFVLSLETDTRIMQDIHKELSLENEREIASVISAAGMPIILAGRGALSSYKAVREFVARTGIRLVASLPAVGVIPTDWNHYRGMVGHTGHDDANGAVLDSDCVIALGARLDLRQTGSLTEEWAKEKTIIRVDVDKGELDNSRIRVDYACNCSVAEFMAKVAPLVNGDDNENGNHRVDR